jgi:hypothetical protein
MRTAVLVGIGLAVVALLASCREHERPAPVLDRERPKRVIEPTAGKVRPLPPHAIRADGIGPYKLGVSLEELAHQLPSGPRIATLDIPGVVRSSVLEDSSILIGGDRGRASFVAVVAGDIARTESGVHVGSSREELERVLGAPVRDLDRAHDPRLVQPTGLPQARVILDDDTVGAIVVLADGATPDKPASDGCVRPERSERDRFGTCLSAATEVVSTEGDAIVVHVADGDRVLDRMHVPGLVFVAPLRPPGEQRDELVAIARTDEPSARSWNLYVVHLEGGKLVRTGDPDHPLYQLTTSAARWIGAELKDLDLYLELAAGPDAIAVTGLLSYTRIGERLRDLVVITPAQVARRHAKPVPLETTDAGTGGSAGAPR